MDEFLLRNCEYIEEQIFFVEDGVADVIEFSGESWKGMYDIVLTERRSYSIELGDILGTDVIDADGNMQITTVSEELRPYVGYYTLN